MQLKFVIAKVKSPLTLEIIALNKYRENFYE